MSRLNVDYRVSLRRSKFAAHWGIHGDEATITFHPDIIWDDGQRSRPDGWTEEEAFIDHLLFNDVMERICLERAHEKIKIKGGRCGTPPRSRCCMLIPTLLMIYPDGWDEIRKDYGLEKKHQ